MWLFWFCKYPVGITHWIISTSIKLKFLIQNQLNFEELISMIYGRPFWNSKKQCHKPDNHTLRLDPNFGFRVSRIWFNHLKPVRSVKKSENVCARRVWQIEVTGKPPAKQTKFRTQFRQVRAELANANLANQEFHWNDFMFGTFMWWAIVYSGQPQSTSTPFRLNAIASDLRSGVITHFASLRQALKVQRQICRRDSRLESLPPCGDPEDTHSRCVGACRLISETARISAYSSNWNSVSRSMSLKPRLIVFLILMRLQS